MDAIISLLECGSESLVGCCEMSAHFAFLQHRRTAERIFTAPFIYIAPNWLTDWLVNGTCWEKKHIVWPASKKKKAVQRPHQCVGPHSLAVSRNPDLLSLCLSLLPKKRRFVFLSVSLSVRFSTCRLSICLSATGGMKNGVIKAEFVKSGENARRLFVCAVSTSKELVGVRVRVKESACAVVRKRKREKVRVWKRDGERERESERGWNKIKKRRRRGENMPAVLPTYCWWLHLNAFLH